MGLGYTYQSTSPVTLIGTKTAANVVTRTTLTATYADTQKRFDTAGMSKVNLSINFQMGASETTNTLSVLVESSADATNFYQIVNESVSAGTSTLTQREFQFVGATATSPYLFSLPIDVFDRYLRVSFKETGVAVNAGSVYAEVTIDGSK